MQTSDSTKEPAEGLSDGELDGLALLREPFPPNQISKLPKPYKKDSEKGKCRECGGYHGLPAVHLDYVGHAALTDRLLDADLGWTWAPVADPRSLGLPVFDGGMWIRLTVCGVTRLGFGCADGKSGGDAVKEMIGDALRNAAMRFGAALDLWHKGQLHEDKDDDVEPSADSAKASAFDEAGYAAWLRMLHATATEAGYEALVADVRSGASAFQDRLRSDKASWTALKNAAPKREAVTA